MNQVKIVLYHDHGNIDFNLDEDKIDWFRKQWIEKSNITMGLIDVGLVGFNLDRFNYFEVKEL